MPSKSSLRARITNVAFALAFVALCVFAVPRSEGNVNVGVGTGSVVCMVVAVGEDKSVRNPEVKLKRKVVFLYFSCVATRIECKIIYHCAGGK